jgi:glycosyltransferase involved in cell wall biosynthesis
MKILYLTENCPRPNNYNSGIFIQKRLQEIKKRKIDFDVFCPVVEYKWDLRLLLLIMKKIRSFNKYPKSLEVDGIRYNYIVTQMNAIQFIKDYYIVYKQLEKLVIEKMKSKKFDLIHAHFAFPSGIISKNISKQLKIPYILTLHGTDIHTLPHRSKKLKNEILESLENAKKCIFVSDHLRKQAIELGYSNKNSVVIPNGYDPNIFYYEDKQEAKKKLGFKKEKLIGFVGNLIDVKNVMILPEIFRRISEKSPNTEYVIIGEGNLRKDLERHFKEYQIPVLFTGRIPQKEVGDYMRAMDVMILPSLNEGYPCVVNEAQACGVYVIGSDRGGIPEAVFGRGSVFPLDEKFAKQVSNKAIKLFEDKNDIHMITQGIEQFTWKSEVKKEIALYDLQ